MFNMRKGEIINFTSGDFSDYRLVALLRIEKDFNLKDEHTAFEIKTYRWEDAFIAHLMSAGLVSLVESREINFDELPDRAPVNSECHTVAPIETKPLFATDVEPLNDAPDGYEVSANLGDIGGWLKSNEERIVLYETKSQSIPGSSAECRAKGKEYIRYRHWDWE